MKTYLTLSLLVILPACATMSAVREAVEKNEEEVMTAVTQDIEDATETAAGLLGVGPWGDAIAAGLLSALGLNQYRNKTRKVALKENQA